jgi:hypothetical protein
MNRLLAESLYNFNRIGCYSPWAISYFRIFACASTNDNTGYSMTAFEGDYHIDAMFFSMRLIPTQSKEYLHKRDKIKDAFNHHSDCYYSDAVSSGILLGYQLIKLNCYSYCVPGTQYLHQWL